MSTKLKVDENILIQISNSCVPSTKEGYLRKKGINSKAFLRRWFVLKRNMMFYYEKRGDKRPLGVIILEGVVVRQSVSYGGYVFEIASKIDDGRKYNLEANSKSEMDQWLYSLSGASYEVLRKRFNFLRIKYKTLIERKQQNEMNGHETECETDSSKSDGKYKTLIERKQQNEINGHETECETDSSKSDGKYKTLRERKQQNDMNGHETECETDSASPDKPDGTNT
jgi:hypothetical protein